MTYRDNIKAIIETNFIGLSEEYIEGVCAKICEIQTEKTYEDGLNDAWECARKVSLNGEDGGIPYEDFKDIFDDISSPYGVFRRYTITEAMAKIKAYEEQKNEIKQWDEICGKSKPKNKLIVVAIGAWGDWHCVDYEGHTFKLDDKYKKYWKKTGKSYPELANILEQLKGDKE